MSKHYSNSNHVHWIFELIEQLSVLKYSSYMYMCVQGIHTVQYIDTYFVHTHHHPLPWAHHCFQDLSNQHVIRLLSQRNVIIINIRIYLEQASTLFTLGLSANRSRFSGCTMEGKGLKMIFALGLLAAAWAMAISRSTTWVHVDNAKSTFSTLSYTLQLQLYNNEYVHSQTARLTLCTNNSSWECVRLF